MADSVLHRQKKHSENMNPTWGTFGGPGDPTLTFGPCAAQSPHLPTTTQNLFPPVDPEAKPQEQMQN